MMVSGAVFTHLYFWRVPPEQSQLPGISLLHPPGATVEYFLFVLGPAQALLFSCTFLGVLFLQGYNSDLISALQPTELSVKDMESELWALHHRGTGQTGGCISISKGGRTASLQSSEESEKLRVICWEVTLASN